MASSEPLTDADRQKLRAVIDARDSRGRTHWEGCHLDPTHRDCAIAMLLDERERLAAENAELRAACESLLPFVESVNRSGIPDQVPLGVDIERLGGTPTVGDLRRIATLLARTTAEGGK